MNEKESLTFTNGITITWNRGLDGGGSIQHKDFLSYMLFRGKKYKTGFEWCSGLGAIGFSIMDAGLCEHMSFMDVYPPASICTYNNAKANNLLDRVTYYSADKIQLLPETVKFDLVVGNPPHCTTVPEDIQTVNPHAVRMLLDEDWDIHKEFFSNIVSRLNPDADIILSEIYENHDIIQMAEAAGLQYIGCVAADELGHNSTARAVLMHFTI